MNDFWQHLDVLKREIRKKDILFFHGGGNIGNLWPKSEYIRREAFEIWKKNIKIVLPQSIFFTNDDEGEKELTISKKIYFGKKVILVCREELSYKFAKENFDCEILLTPDMVMYNSQSDLSTKYNRSGALLCLRKDKEKKLTENEVEQIEKCLLKRFDEVTLCDTVLPKFVKVQERALALENFLKQLAQSQVVFTDRLHGMVFCALTCTPCVVYPNSYHKVECCAEWLKKLGYIRVIYQIDDFADAIDCVINEKQRNYDICNLQNEFKQLKDLLINL